MTGSVTQTGWEHTPRAPGAGSHRPEQKGRAPAPRPAPGHLSEFTLQTQPWTWQSFDGWPDLPPNQLAFSHGDQRI